MKRLIIAILSLSLVLPVYAKGSSGGTKSYMGSARPSGYVNSRNTQVRQYTKKDEMHVQAHRRTVLNYTKRDNYSTKGNVNPYTGKAGTINP